MFPLKPFPTYLPFPHLAVMQCQMLLIMVLHSIANMLEMPSITVFLVRSRVPFLAI